MGVLPIIKIIVDFVTDCVVVEVVVDEFVDYDADVVVVLEPH